MKAEYPRHLDERTSQAVSELEGIIAARYPGVTFALKRSIDEPASLDLIATVDVDDPDEVLEAVLERVVELNVEEGIPIHVVPVRTSERIEAYRQGIQHRRTLPLRSLLARIHE